MENKILACLCFHFGLFAKIQNAWLSAGAFQVICRKAPSVTQTEAQLILMRWKLNSFWWDGRERICRGLEKEYSGWATSLACRWPTFNPWHPIRSWGPLGVIPEYRIEPGIKPEYHGCGVHTTRTKQVFAKLKTQCRNWHEYPWWYPNTILTWTWNSFRVLNICCNYD